MEAGRLFILICLIIIHWLLVINNALYVFFRKSNKYDWVYFTLLCITIISWTVSKGECLLSYFEKLCIDSKYVFNSKGDMPFVNLFFKENSTYVLFVLCLLTYYCVYIMLSYYNVPWQVKLTFIYFMAIPTIKAHLKNGSFLGLTYDTFT
jgi:hypothetical protein